MGCSIKIRLQQIDLLLQMLPLSTNIKDAFKHGRDDEQNFIQNLSLFLCTYLKDHSQLIEKKQDLNETLMEVGLNVTDRCRFE